MGPSGGVGERAIEFIGQGAEPETIFGREGARDVAPRNERATAAGGAPTREDRLRRG